MKIKITRIYQEDCTIGILNAGGFRCFTLELPWLDNKQDESCIPAGLYECHKYFSHKHGDCVAITNVVNRTLVRIHSGNFTREILGCILVGDSLKDFDKDGIIDVMNSKNTLNKLMAILPHNFLLEMK